MENNRTQLQETQQINLSGREELPGGKPVQSTFTWAVTGIRP